MSDTINFHTTCLLIILHNLQVIHLCIPDVINQSTVYVKRTVNVKWVQMVESQCRATDRLRTRTSHWRETTDITSKNWEWTWKTVIFIMRVFLFFLFVILLHAVWSSLSSNCIRWRTVITWTVEPAFWVSTSKVVVLRPAVGRMTSVNWRRVRTLCVRLGRALLLAEFSTTVLEPNLHSRLLEFTTAFNAELKIKRISSWGNLSVKNPFMRKLL